MATEGFNAIIIWFFFCFTNHADCAMEKCECENDLLTICVHSEVIHRFQEAGMCTCPDSKPH